MSCKHPNIVRLYAAFEYDGEIFMIMEYVSKGNLFKHLNQTSGKKFTEEKVAIFFKDIIAAFEYLHSKDPPILHRFVIYKIIYLSIIIRDLKPENILVDQNLRLKLADFGWSRQKETNRTTFCGTPDYLSPEMINGTEQTEKLDIWCMGILMFELLHGQAPFSLNKKFNPRNKLQEIQRDILKGDITFKKEISEEAQEIIRAMMDPDPLMLSLIHI